MNADKSGETPPLDSAAIDAAAVAWLCERDEGFSAERAAEFAQWLEADSRHRRAAAKVERGLDLLHELPALRLLVRVRETVNRPRLKSARALRWPWWTGAAAAAVFVALLIWGPVGFVGNPPQKIAATTTAPTRTVLQDGSVVNVNTHGAVEVQLAARVRQVKLARGEAHFEVRSDPSRPFIVLAGDVSVRAVGTMFAVRLKADGVDVLVEEGKVVVAPIEPTASETGRIVAAGERATVTRIGEKNTSRVEQISAPAMSAALSWHRRFAIFNDTPLRDVVLQFNRRNATQIELADPTLGERRFGGALAADDLDALLRLLEREGGIVIERRGSAEIVLRRAP